MQTPPPFSLPLFLFLIHLLYTHVHALAAWKRQGSDGHPYLRQHLLPPHTPRRIVTGRSILSTEEDDRNGHAHLTGSFESLRVSEHLKRHGRVFATIVCDDGMEAGVSVLHEGLLRNGHREPLVVVAGRGVGREVRARLSLLALVKVFWVGEGGGAFCGGAGGGGGECGYLKLLLFGLGEVDKLVFLEYDTVVLKSLEGLWDMPPFGGVRESMTGLFETSVMVVVPDWKVFEVLREEYCGGVETDDDVIRRVVPDEAWTEVGDTYNVPQEHMDALWYRRVDLRPMVIHFKGEVKPWNWWRVNGGGGLSVEAFRLWCEVAEGTGYDCGGRGGGRMEGVMQPSGWSDKKRLTVLLSTYHRGTWQGLVRHYTGFKVVNQVVLVWHDPFGDPPLAAGLGLKVVVWQPKVDSLNNRFFAPGNLTECVYVADDDMKVNEQQLMRGFQIWKGHTRRLVGYFPRRWMMESPYYSAKVHDGYNVVLTKGLFTHRYFLYLYWHLLPRRIHDIVDKYGNCEDILFNMMVSGYNGAAPLHVLVPGTITDLGHGSGISARGSHFATRLQCVRELIDELALTQAPLSVGSYSELPLKNKERA